MTGTRHVKFTNLLNINIHNHVACNVLCWSYWWMATAISLEGVVLQLNSCSVGA